MSSVTKKITTTIIDDDFNTSSNPNVSQFNVNSSRPRKHNTPQIQTPSAQDLEYSGKKDSGYNSTQRPTRRFDSNEYGEPPSASRDRHEATFHGDRPRPQQRMNKNASLQGPMVANPKSILRSGHQHEHHHTETHETKIGPDGELQDVMITEDSDYSDEDDDDDADNVSVNSADFIEAATLRVYDLLRIQCQQMKDFKEELKDERDACADKSMVRELKYKHEGLIVGLNKIHEEEREHLRKKLAREHIRLKDRKHGQPALANKPAIYDISRIRVHGDIEEITKIVAPAVALIGQQAASEKELRDYLNSQVEKGGGNLLDSMVTNDASLNAFRVKAKNEMAQKLNKLEQLVLTHEEELQPTPPKQKSIVKTVEVDEQQHLNETLSVSQKMTKVEAYKKERAHVLNQIMEKFLSEESKFNESLRNCKDKVAPGDKMSDADKKKFIERYQRMLDENRNNISDHERETAEYIEDLINAPKKHETQGSHFATMPDLTSNSIQRPQSPQKQPFVDPRNEWLSKQLKNFKISSEKRRNELIEYHKHQLATSPGYTAELAKQQQNELQTLDQQELQMYDKFKTKLAVQMEQQLTPNQKPHSSQRPQSPQKHTSNANSRNEWISNQMENFKISREKRRKELVEYHKHQLATSTNVSFDLAKQQQNELETLELQDQKMFDKFLAKMVVQMEQMATPQGTASQSKRNTSRIESYKKTNEVIKDGKKSITVNKTINKTNSNDHHNASRNLSPVQKGYNMSHAESHHEHKDQSNQLNDTVSKIVEEYVRLRELRRKQLLELQSNQLKSAHSITPEIAMEHEKQLEGLELYEQKEYENVLKLVEAKVKGGNEKHRKHPTKSITKTTNEVTTDGQNTRTKTTTKRTNASLPSPRSSSHSHAASNSSSTQYFSQQPLQGMDSNASQRSRRQGSPHPKMMPNTSNISNSRIEHSVSDMNGSYVEKTIKTISLAQPADKLQTQRSSSPKSGSRYDAKDVCACPGNPYAPQPSKGDPSNNCKCICKSLLPSIRELSELELTEKEELHRSLRRWQVARRDIISAMTPAKQ